MTPGGRLLFGYITIYGWEQNRCYLEIPDLDCSWFLVPQGSQHKLAASFGKGPWQRWHRNFTNIAPVSNVCGVLEGKCGVCRKLHRRKSWNLFLLTLACSQNFGFPGQTLMDWCAGLLTWTNIQNHPCVSGYSKKIEHTKIRTWRDSIFYWQPFFSSCLASRYSRYTPVLLVSKDM